MLAMFSGGLNAASEPAQQTRASTFMEYTVSGNTLLKRTLLERIVYPASRRTEGYRRCGEGASSAGAGLSRCWLSYRIRRHPRTGREGWRGTPAGHGRQNRAFAHHRIALLTRLARLRGGAVTPPPAASRKWISADGIGTINRASPDRSVTPVLRAGQTPGMVEVELKVKDEVPLHGALEVNNLNTADTTPDTRMGRCATTISGKSLQCLGAVSNRRRKIPKKSGVRWHLRHAVSGRQQQTRFYAVNSSSDVATVSDLAVIGDGNIYGVRAVFPFAAQANFFHSLTLGADYKDFNESVALQGPDTLNTPISYLPFSLVRGHEPQRGRSQHALRCGHDVLAAWCG